MHSAAEIVLTSRKISSKTNIIMVFVMAPDPAFVNVFMYQKDPFGDDFVSSMSFRFILIFYVI